MRETVTGRVLAAVLLAGTLALAWRQSRSPLAKALSEGRSVLGWLKLDGRNPALFLTVYQPVRRTLDIVCLPGGPRAKGGLSAEAAAGARLAALAPQAGIGPGLPVWRGALAASSDEPPLDAADWLARRIREPRSWLRNFYASRDAAGSRFDRFLLALELQRLGPQALRPAWLPPEDQAGGWLNRLILGGGSAAPERITVEVLNASTEPGAAGRAKNILRLKGADVMSVGNVARQARTIVYDRTGRFENASAVARMLGCPAAARALTQMDLKRLVDVSVVLADDCPLP
jgi:hypothetical protein